MKNKFELDVIKILKDNNFKIIDENPKYVDVMVERDNKKIAIEIKNESDPTLFLPKAFGQLMASKYIYETNEEWLVISSKLLDSEYLKVMKDNNIKFFTVEGNKLVEIRDFLTSKRDRKIRRGIDLEKITKIWTVLAQSGDWIHVAEISRRTKMDECTVRWYLNHYLSNAIDEERIGPKIKLRLIRLKTGLTLESYIKALNYINKIKVNKNIKSPKKVSTEEKTSNI